MLNSRLLKTKKTDQGYTCRIIGFIGLVLILVVSGCTKEISPPTRPNAVLLTLDTTRLDHIGAYGNPWINTPNLDRICRNSTQFVRCVSTSNSTNPSHSSMFTSLPCIMHQVYNNKTTLPPELTRLPEEYKKEGYSTMAITSAFHLNPSVSGFGQGFDLFLECPDNERIAGEAVNTLLQHPDYNEMVSKPFFGWFHFFDPHMLYEPPAIYRKLFYSGNPYELEPKTTKGLNIPRDLWAWVNDWIGEVKDIEYLYKLYGGEVTYLDYWLGELFNDLKERNLWDQTLICVTADHGEALGEHGINFNHYSLYNESIMVPLIVKQVSTKNKSMVLERAVSTLDIAPTMLSECNIGVPDQFEGKQIEFTTTPEDDWSDRYLFSEQAHHHGVAIIQNDWKYYDNRLKNTKLLLDMENNPTEDINMIDEQTSLRESFLEQLSSFEPRSSSAKPQEINNKKITDQLKALGYVE